MLEHRLHSSPYPLYSVILTPNNISSNCLLRRYLCRKSDLPDLRSCYRVILGMEGGEEGGGKCWLALRLEFTPLLIPSLPRTINRHSDAAITRFIGAFKGPIPDVLERLSRLNNRDSKSWEARGFRPRHFGLTSRINVLTLSLHWHCDFDRLEYFLL